MKPTLELFYFDSCPYCQIVIQALNSLKISVEYCNIYEDEKHLNRLIKETGRRMVPCLFIDGRPMFESADIVRWLQDNASQLKDR